MYSSDDTVASQSKINEIVRLTDILETQPLQYNNKNGHTYYSKVRMSFLLRKFAYRRLPGIT